MRERSLYSMRSLILSQCRDLKIGGDVTEFGSLNHSSGKRVLNNLKTICLRFWKVVVQIVAVIKLRVNNRCGNGTGSFEVKIGTDTTKFTNVIIKRVSIYISRRK